MSAPLTVVTWKWKARPGYRSSFNAGHVNILARMVRRHFSRPHQFVCVTDDDKGIDPDIGIVPLWSDFAHVPSPHGGNNPSCYRRLKMFSAEARQMFGPRFVSLDLDTVIVGDLAPLWDRSEDIVLYSDTNPKNPYNGSMILHQAGTRSQIWEQFDPVRSPQITRQKGFFGSDQAWIGHILGPGEAKWGVADGVYSYRCNLKPKGGALPADARVVNFHGQIDPDHQEAQRLEWVRRHYV